MRTTAIATSPSVVRTGTRGALLDAAERLFAARGLDTVSVRDITRAARANLGAINYHFGTRRGLIAAVFARRMEPLMQARLAALDALEVAAGDRPPRLEAVLEAFFRPAVAEALPPHGTAAAFGRLMARCLMEPNPQLDRLLRGYIEPVVRRYDAALLRTAPDLTLDEVFWRMHLLLGALHQSLLMMDRPPPPGRRLCRDAETYLRRFLTFAVAAFRAPPAG